MAGRAVARVLRPKAPMSDRANIALACTHSAERVALTEWLSVSGYHPVALTDLSHLDDDLQHNAIEALIADMVLIPREDDVRNLVRRLGANRPLMVLGDSGRLPASTLGDVSVISRPVTRDAILLSVGLALAEGRPARRFPRRHVEPIPATAQGISVVVREASSGGVGLEVSGSRQAVLPPYFNLRIPEFGVHVLVKRAWIVPVGVDRMRCGGTVEGDLNGATRAWAEFAREAPAPVASVRRRMAI
jgi:hypothetical protein